MQLIDLALALSAWWALGIGVLIAVDASKRHYEFSKAFGTDKVALIACLFWPIVLLALEVRRARRLRGS